MWAHDAEAAATPAETLQPATPVPDSQELSVVPSSSSFLPLRPKPYPTLGQGWKGELPQLFRTVRTIQSEEGILGGLYRGWPWYASAWLASIFFVVLSRLIVEIIPISDE